MFCEKCGAKLGKDAEFCRECGTKVSKSDDKAEVTKEAVKPSGKKRKSLVLLIVIIIVLLIAAIAALDYFEILDLGLTDFIKLNKGGSNTVTQESMQNSSIKSVEEQREENETKSADSSQPSETEATEEEPVKEEPAEVVYAMEGDFWGEWVLMGYKDYLEDEINPVDAFYYVILQEGKATMGSYGPYYTDDIVHNGPYGIYYNYRDSGGINDYNYLDVPSRLSDFMMDQDGRLLRIQYYGDGNYEEGIYIYEKVPEGSIESYLNSQGKSLYDERIEKDDYVFSPINFSEMDHLIFADIVHWNFVGFAENPYYSGEYDPESMLNFTGMDSYSWQSYFKLNYDEGEYYSTSAGYVDIYTPFVYSDEYQCSYYRVDNYGGSNVKSLNIFVGNDLRAYLSIASTDDAHECISHFYVYEMAVHDYFSKTIDFVDSTEIFYGYWKSVRKTYYADGDSVSYKEGDFDIYAIYPDGTLDFVQHIEEYGEDALYTYSYDYIDKYYYLEVEEFYSNPDIYTLFFLNEGGQLVAFDYKINENGLNYIAYSLFDPYEGSLQDCKDESFNEN